MEELPYSGHKWILVRSDFVQEGVAINILVNGEERPYIFVEVKRFAAGIQDATKQLKSYMDTNDKVRYGVATDGLEIIILNRKGEILGDIPKCNPHFLPESKENKTYINFKNNRKYIYSYEKNDESNIEISDAESNLHLDTNSFVNVPILEK